MLSPTKIQRSCPTRWGRLACSSVATTDRGDGRPERLDLRDEPRRRIDHACPAVGARWPRWIEEPFEPRDASAATITGASPTLAAPGPGGGTVDAGGLNPPAPQGAWGFDSLSGHVVRTGWTP